ncbi:hypothetical protein WOSG25_200190 [Weissella oryzae SG25]|uniref:Uncharacterized protein n=1 Tax=Weissella oryzae (strain DSM 25784 / JCM 18191 / LMG 30913 / SG25) TaxID=1329250 RepID=A0A069CX34_WEIOS|nr:hypothetical protein [Weissella oryzae]GAK31937.1 hypothetical protein WOSG25_200190 [Weissella oryzae SG25]
MIDAKQILSLSDAALAEMQKIASAGETPAIIALNDELKKITQMGTESGLSPMMLSYMADIQKNMKFMIGTMNSLHTHVKNRAGEIQNLIQEVSTLK